MQQEAQPQDTPPVADTPVERTNDNDSMMSDLGAVVAASEQPPATPPADPEADLTDPDKVPEQLMRDDYLKRVNKLKEMADKLKQERAEFEQQRQQPQRQPQQPDPNDQQEEPPPRMPNVGEGTILARFGITIDPDTLETPNEKAMYNAMRVMETVLERHMIATDVHVRQMNKVASDYGQVAKGVQSQALGQAQKVLDAARAEIKASFGVDVDAKALAVAARRYGKGLMEKDGTDQVSASLLVRSWQIDNPTAQKKQPAPAPPARAKVPPVAGQRAPSPAVQPGTPSEPRTGRMSDDEKILADLQAELARQ